MTPPTRLDPATREKMEAVKRRLIEELEADDEAEWLAIGEPAQSPDDRHTDVRDMTPNT